MIYITGDTHGDFRRFSKRDLHLHGINLTDKDYVIICGDFGLCWAEDKEFEHYCNIFSQKQYTILWVQGNHENYDMIAEYPLEEWHGGKVRHIIRNKVILLERGQVFDIDGRTFFTFGGASSHDLQGGILDRNDCDFDHKKKRAIDMGLPYRIIHESWWPQELPDDEEMEEGRRNLEKVNYKVDYVITHCCATSIQNLLDSGSVKFYQNDRLTDYLDELEKKLEYTHWYFGHYHDDVLIDEKHTLLYYTILPLKRPEQPQSDFHILGKPRYKIHDMVEFHSFDRNGDECKKRGRVSIIDAYGTFEQETEPSYDIMVAEENCLYKHIRESDVLRRIMPS